MTWTQAQIDALVAENKKLKKLKRLKKDLKEVKKVYKFACHKKGFDLHWLGRRQISDVLAQGPSHPSHSAVCKILRKHPKEATIIKNGGFESNWEMGFWSGVCALGRLVAGVVDPTAGMEEEIAKSWDCANWDELDDEFKEEERVNCVDRAWEEFPMLDS